MNGRDFAPHFAAVLETGCTSDATELIYNPETEDIEFVEPAAGGKIMEELESKIKSNTKLIYLETPANPTLVIDRKSVV